MQNDSNTPEFDTAEEATVSRRNFLLGAKGWSAVVAGLALGLTSAPGPAEAGAGWINRRGGGGGWVNGHGGGGGWINGAGGWINGHVGGSGGWINGAGGGGGWVNRRGGGGWINGRL